MTEEEERSRGLEMMRKKLEEWNFRPYYFQAFNEKDSSKFPHLSITPQSYADIALLEYRDKCEYFESFKFSIEPVILGEVKLCSYSELQKITQFKENSLIQKTLSGRLYRGFISEGGYEGREVIVKTWDFLRPFSVGHDQRPGKFCDEIEMLTDEKANTHPNLVKLHTFCLETRLATVYDQKFTRVLSDVLLEDHFGWNNRIKVATQLADLFVWFHGKKIAIGSVTASCVIIDAELNTKVFDFGFVSNHVNEDSEIQVLADVGFDAPEVSAGKRTMKSDVYIFGLLLLELISKKKYDFTKGFCGIQSEIELGKQGLVHECFKEVDGETATEITLLTQRCMEFQPDKRPEMNTILKDLKAMGKRGEKRGRGEDVAE